MNERIPESEFPTFESWTEEPTERTLSAIGIHNRADARRAGLRNPQPFRSMAVPRMRKKPKKKRPKGY